MTKPNPKSAEAELAADAAMAEAKARHAEALSNSMGTIAALAKQAARGHGGLTAMAKHFATNTGPGLPFDRDNAKDVYAKFVATYNATALADGHGVDLMGSDTTSKSYNQQVATLAHFANPVVVEALRLANTAGATQEQVALWLDDTGDFWERVIKARDVVEVKARYGSAYNTLSRVCRLWQERHDKAIADALAAHDAKASAFDPATVPIAPVTADDLRDWVRKESVKAEDDDADGDAAKAAKKLDARLADWLKVGKTIVTKHCVGHEELGKGIELALANAERAIAQWTLAQVESRIAAADRKPTLVVAGGTDTGDQEQKAA